MDITVLAREVGQFIVSVYEVGRDAVLWAGRWISTEYQHIHPGIEVAWSKAVAGFQATLAFLRTGIGLSAMGFLIGSILLLVSDLDSLHNHPARYILQAGAVVCFIGAGVLLMMGTAVIF